MENCPSPRISPQKPIPNSKLLWTTLARLSHSCKKKRAWRNERRAAARLGYCDAERSCRSKRHVYRWRLDSLRASQNRGRCSPYPTFRHRHWKVSGQVMEVHLRCDGKITWRDISPTRRHSDFADGPPSGARLCVSTNREARHHSGGRRDRSLRWQHLHSRLFDEFV